MSGMHHRISNALNQNNHLARLRSALCSTLFVQLRWLAIATVSIIALASLACTGGPASNTNTGASATAANVNTNAAASAESTPLTAREPESYTAEMTITAQAEGNNTQQAMPPIQFIFAKSGADRRWEFQSLPLVGNAIYIEKSGLKYLVLPAQKRYAEINPQELGVPLDRLLTPTMAIEQLKSRAPYEKLPPEMVNNRQADKYRFAGAINTQTQAGTAQGDTILYVDQETGLPLRADINVATSGGQNARIMIETKNIQLNPPLTMFDVPEGMKKVTTQEIKQQLDAFVTMLRAAAKLLGPQMGITVPVQ
ncbi:MAG TPA: hypothetical protein VNN73_20950 [Blastocatellia bacterium]|nr:hypothetical protein [Blastocatellia bacterium]